MPQLIAQGLQCQCRAARVADEPGDAGTEQDEHHRRRHPGNDAKKQLAERFHLDCQSWIADTENTAEQDGHQQLSNSGTGKSVNHDTLFLSLWVSAVIAPAEASSYPIGRAIRYRLALLSTLSHGESSHGASSPALLRHGCRGASLYPRGYAPEHAATAAEPADPCVGGRAGIRAVHPPCQGCRSDCGRRGLPEGSTGHPPAGPAGWTQGCAGRAGHRRQPEAGVHQLRCVASIDPEDHPALSRTLSRGGHCAERGQRETADRQRAERAGGCRHPARSRGQP
ncbi:UNVERIFIED_CONTAM: hypothetical protein NCL1_57366 [Trichonephila clavipes]